MSRLSKFIEGLQRNVVVVQSTTTNSQYYQVGFVKIRISDHFSERVNCADIQIVIPFNSKTIYLCRINEGVPVMTFTLKELKQFISNYIVIANIKAHTIDFMKIKDKVSKEQSERDKAEFQKKSDEITNKQIESELTNNNSSSTLSKLLGFNIDDCTIRLLDRYYIKCANDIKRQCHLRIGDLSAKKRKIIRTKIVGSNIPWTKVIELIKEAKETKVLKGSASNLEAWLITKFKN